MTRPLSGSLAAALALGLAASASAPAPASGAFVYGVTLVDDQLIAVDTSTFNTVNDLYRFNIATGQSTLIASLSDTLESIAFGPGGVLYGLGKLDGDLYTVNTTTGALTLVGYTGVSPGSPVDALTFGPDGTLYATFDDALYTLNTSTGAATPVGGTPAYSGFASISGIAFAATVPEPSSIALAATGLLPLAAFALRRRIAGRP